MDKQWSLAIAIVLIVAIVLFGAGIFWYYKIRPHQSSVPAAAGEGELRLYGDGTAYVRGEIVDFIHGCEVDGTCSIIVRAQGQNIEMVINEGMAIPVPGARVSYSYDEGWISQAKNVTPGTMVQMYGTIKKASYSEDGYSVSYGMNPFDSPDSFILGENDPIPASSSATMSRSSQ